MSLLSLALDAVLGPVEQHRAAPASRFHPSCIRTESDLEADGWTMTATRVDRARGTSCLAHMPDGYTTRPCVCGTVRDCLGCVRVVETGTDRKGPWSRLQYWNKRRK